ncbi:hypothetical protein [Gluconobacter roseus]|uniref:Uncharacterized protein n=1 Tax=Gluconobacter roseus NBRC 3990 TaxID=1307950 RepID=A0A4Y3M4X0_9PROT|nr:hypothetical protein [Gluconobacter roseus]KXV42871.1 hypothetical protein AD943_12560 [Gluconobacter roseus]GBR48838.1 hypothetical protein AA3990_2279 [Gluconobacter roseus NBRC 3990]GEB04352.1 hypothetical protein GRO01_19280 [Gluconobacter roseus NBRC 3990]GLP92795.1 hypothetical protein GCM10007871_07730 [Gluconobacter roseus NBRC 3990]
MGYDLNITRDPVWTGRPGRGLTLEEWFDVIQRDDELCFAPSPDPRKYPSCDAEWLAHPKPEETPQGTRFFWCGGNVTYKYPDEYQIIKMVQISHRLNAIVIGDNGERYDLDEHGKLVVDESAPSPQPGAVAYGIGCNPCSNFTKAIAASGTPDGLMFYQWYLGVVTAVNAVRYHDGKSVMTFSLTPEFVREDQIFLVQYCQEHPDRLFHQAALALVRLRQARCGS